MLQGWNVKQIFGNFEYELDEVRRDLKFCKLAKEAGMRTTLVHDKCVVDPGLCRTKQGKVYTVRRIVESKEVISSYRIRCIHHISVLGCQF